MAKLYQRRLREPASAVSVAIVACSFYALLEHLRYVRDVRDGGPSTASQNAPTPRPSSRGRRVVPLRAQSAHADASSRRVVTSVNRTRGASARGARPAASMLASRWRDACFTGRQPDCPGQNSTAAALVFDDRETERDYHGQLAAFALAHRHRDVHLSVERPRLKDGDQTSACCAAAAARRAGAPDAGRLLAVCGSGADRAPFAR